MKDYLYILGVPNFANYEASASLIRVPRDGGQIEYVCMGEDRLTRVKHTYMFPLRAIDYCLNHFGLESLDQVDYLATDYARLPRWLNSGPAYRKLEHDYLKLKLRFPREKILVLDHHDAHAASCYYPSNFDESLVLIVDGMGSELMTQSAYHFIGDKIAWREHGYDWGIGRLYSLITAAVLPYGPEKGYGKVMGLAAYGEHETPSGVDFGAKVSGLTTDYSSFFSRYPISHMVAKNIPFCTDRSKVMAAPFPRIAFEIQKECEDRLIEFAQYAHDQTGCTNLCLAGGVVLNGRANYLITKRTPIKNIWVQPACSDTGIPFGLALWAYYQRLADQTSQRCTVSMANAYCGSPYAKTETFKFLEELGIKSTPTTADKVAKLISEGHVFANFEGGSEFGPRALGHRSIIADPRSMDMKDRLNKTVKFREPYRPYAPAILRDHVNEYFDWDQESPFMLIVADVRPEARDKIPAVNHIDNTARIQTVTKEDNGFFYEIISAFHKITGVPVLLNTSFNINKEPIVETPIDALLCAFGTQIDFLIVEGHLINCADYRSPELLKKLLDQRSKTIEENYEKVRARHLTDYDATEMNSYLQEETRIAEWYRDYRSKYELEKLLISWGTQKRVLIFGTRAHTKCLYLYIPDFPTLNVSYFVTDDQRAGEKDPFSHVFTESDWEGVDWSKVDEVLISTHEYQRDFLKIASTKVPKNIPIHSIYDSACDSLLNVLPSRWPVANPLEAKAKALHFHREVKRTASNIDFDFEPAKIDISERYAVIATYHALTGANFQPAFPTVGAVHEASFEKHLKQITENFSLCRCADLLNPKSDIGSANVVLAFDDGLKEVLTIAAPLLKKYQAGATVFVCGLPLVESRLLTVQKVQFLMAKLGLKKLQGMTEELIKEQFPKGLPREEIAYAQGYEFYRYDETDVRDFKLDLNYRLPVKEIDSIISKIFSSSFSLSDEKELAAKVYLSREDLLRLHEQGIEVGAHTYGHIVLPRLDFEEQKKSILESMDVIRGITGQPDVTVSFPFGFSDKSTKRSLKELGALGGFGYARKLVTPKDLQERWDIPRYDINDCFNRKTDELTYEIFSSLPVSD